MNRLHKRGNAYSLVQILRLLRHAIDEDKRPSFFDRVRIRADLSFSAAEGEVCSVEKYTGKISTVEFLVTSTLLELYGTGSPLPLFYTQELIREQNHGSSISREFFDIINSLIYESYFYLWQKCSLAVSLFEAPNKDLWERLFCFCGLGSDSLKKKYSVPGRFIAFSALASRPVKTAEGLRAMLAELTSAVDISVEQCLIRKASIPLDQRCAIGEQGNILGESIYLGNSLRDRMNAIRIHIGPLMIDALREYLPDGKILELFGEVIRFYIDRLIIWDYKIGIYTSTMKTIQPGNRTSALLGWNTWLFSGKLKRDVVYTTIKPKSV
ncbi:MAG: type VI secretion system baseplate subunit TssG [Chitinispirillaceae bacterium]|nr:type VI secretion system baseplate subunit TssG [Chitinispirillaceae bacterium]